MSTMTVFPYLAGVASVDVTPPVGSKLAGFAARTEDSTGVYLPLRAIVTAITERATDQTVIIVSLEWLGFYDNTDDVRALIRTATGVPADHIMLCGTHTHGGPPMRKHIDAETRTGIDAPFLRAAFAKMAAAAKVAMANRQPVALRSSLGWCGFAHSRRQPDGKGGVVWMPTLDAPHDHTVPIVVFEDEAGQLKHVLFGYTAHPTAGGPCLEIGGDYAGVAMVELEQMLGCTAAFLQGCAGDQKPYVPDASREGFPLMYPLTEVRSMGRRLADAVAREIWRGQWRPVTGPLAVCSRKLALQTAVLSRSEYAAWLDSDNAFFVRWAQKHVTLLDRGERPATELIFEVQTVQFGQDLVLVALAGEMSVEYGLRLVKEFGGRFRQVWPVGYANEMVGYVPSERQLPEGGYEVLTNMQYIGKSGPCTSGTEEHIFAAIGEMLGVN